MHYKETLQIKSCEYEYIHEHMNAKENDNIHAFARHCKCIHTNTNKYIHTHANTYILTNTYIQIHTYKYQYKYMHTNTYMHA